ncbi:MAG: hypothetical protein EZS28_025969 [Streblomastix strix]|uniref:Uncharacterized protein n=1 Tax=Streblomastix strix TaxID=222440 RepID=A0A5J4V783_9EUKA|nr:MAG: hypothetical protein EZS28_025969 [Streblomastix strix]
MPQIYRSIHEAVIDLIVLVAEQIIEQFEIESKDQEELMNKLEGTVDNGIDGNGDEDLSEYVIEPKHVTNGNDGLRKNDSGTQLQAIVKGEAISEINITKISAITSPHNVNRLEELSVNGCWTQLQAATNENGHVIHQAIYNSGNENSNEQAKDNRTGGNENNQESNNENQLEKQAKLQDIGNTKLIETGSIHSTYFE